MSTEAKPLPERTATARYVVRCGVMRTLGVMTARGDGYRYGTRIIARTPRGLEVGEVLCEATESALQHLEGPPEGQVLREATAQDENEIAHLRTRAEEAFAVCQRHIDRLQLAMQLVDVETIFGGERIVVYYLAESRIDFRQLVRDLASEFQTRVEMRQIGVRDEAKLLADYGDCGKPVCCNTHLSKMPPVSMKMAKLQKATLDPTKISGRCGRLKCCLRYEYDTYEELRRELPSPGSQIVTATGHATVVGHEILAQQLLVHTEDNRRILIGLGEVLSVVRRGGAKNRKDRAESKKDTGSGSPRGGAPSEGDPPS